MDFKKVFIQIRDVLVTVGRVALPVVANTVSPGLGQLITVILNSVLLSEARYPEPGTGAAKMDNALSIVEAVMPVLVQTMESATGRALADEKLLATGARKITDGIVDVLNAFSAFRPALPPVVGAPAVATKL